MRKVNSQLECPGCKIKTKVHFKKPTVMSPVIFTYSCSGCQSDIQVKVKKFAGSDPGQVRIFVLNVKPSKLLLEMMKEEQEHNAKPLEEIEKGEENAALSESKGSGEFQQETSPSDATTHRKLFSGLVSS